MNFICPQFTTKYASNKTKLTELIQVNLFQRLRNVHICVCAVSTEPRTLKLF